MTAIAHFATWSCDQCAFSHAASSAMALGHVIGFIGYGSKPLLPPNVREILRSLEELFLTDNEKLTSPCLAWFSFVGELYYMSRLLERP